MKTLYVSDLDGTLLQSSQRTSDFTNNTINDLAEKGVLFSYATARSYQTSHKVTAGLNARIPLIIYNGAMIVDNTDGRFLIQNFFGPDSEDLLEDLENHGISPIVYAFIKGEEKFSFVPSKCTRGMDEFLRTREGDKRTNPVETTEALRQGEIFYFTCIDEPDKLKPLYDKYKDKYHCVFQKDIYSGDQWLEIMPSAATKANATKQLQKALERDRLVVFGDGLNDMDMFQIADEAYAVSNAAEELKAIATAVIGCNDDDGVAKWLAAHAL